LTGFLNAHIVQMATYYIYMLSGECKPYK